MPPDISSLYISWSLSDNGMKKADHEIGISLFYDEHAINALLTLVYFIYRPKKCSFYPSSKGCSGA